MLGALLLTTACTTDMVTPTPTPTSDLATPTSASSVGRTPVHADLCQSPGGPAVAIPLLAQGERFAFVQRDVDTARFWLEGADTVLGIVDTVRVAISPDRRLLAYWARDVAAPERAVELRVRELATGQERAIVTSRDSRGGALAWSCDHRSLLVAAVKPGSGTGGRMDAPLPEYTALRLIDLATGTEGELSRFPGELVVPLAWNARLRAAAAFVQQRSFVAAYLLVRGVGDVRRWDLSPDGTVVAASTVEADTAATTIFATGSTVNPVSTGVFRWPIDDAARRSVRSAEAGDFLLTARQRPGTADAFALVRRIRRDGPDRLEVWPADARDPARVLVPDLAELETSTLSPRADGSVFLARHTLPLQARTVFRVDPTGRADPVKSPPIFGIVGESIIVGEQAVAALGAPAIRATLDRQQAIGRVSALAEKIRRLDRSDAKLVEWRDVLRLLSGRINAGAAAPGAAVWAVAIAGDILADTGSTRIALRYGVWFIDADSGAVLEFNSDARPLWVWPHYWDDLLDRAPNPPARLPAPGRDSGPRDFGVSGDCGFAAGAVRNGDQLVWLLDCGPAANRAARATLGPMLERQGWTACGSGAAAGSWTRGDLRIGVSEGSGVAPNYIRLSQSPRAATGC